LKNLWHFGLIVHDFAMITTRAIEENGLVP
jgi:hypothetical protein